MAPVVLRTRNYRFMIHTRDHPPAHIHVYGPDVEAKFVLNPKVACSEAKGLSLREIERIRRFIETNQEFILEVWENIHGE